MNKNLHDRLVSAVLDADRARANQLIDDWAAVNGYDRAVIEVVSPVLEDIGNMYAEAGEFSLAQAYVGGKIAEDTLAKVLKHQDLATQKKHQRVVVIGFGA